MANPDNNLNQQKRFRWRNFFFVFFFLLVVALSSLIGFLIPVVSRFALLEAILALSPTDAFVGESNLLVLGIDEADAIHRSDTIMVVHLNPTERKAYVVSIPRDTLVVIPGRGLDKINHAFAFGGVKLTKQTVENFLGIDIQNYVTVNIRGLANIVDNLGGITVNVDKRMYYIDYAGGLYIDLWPGTQRLNGKNAVAYVRFRHDGEGDFGRMRRQQQFLSAIATELMNRNNLLKSPRLFLQLLSMLDSNLSSRQMLGTALAIRGAYECSQVQMTSIPGQDEIINGIYYYKPNAEEVGKISEQFLMQKIPLTGGNRTWPEPLPEKQS
ncbi:MAG: LCP family protein [Candidatus Margulisiibacteriota bacterium]